MASEEPGKPLIYSNILFQQLEVGWQEYEPLPLPSVDAASAHDTAHELDRYMPQARSPPTASPEDRLTLRCFPRGSEVFPDASRRVLRCACSCLPATSV